MKRRISGWTQADLTQPFGAVSAEQRRQAEQFYLDLVGWTPPRSGQESVMRRGNVAGPAVSAEQRRQAEQFYLDLVGRTPPRSGRESVVIRDPSFGMGNPEDTGDKRPYDITTAGTEQLTPRPTVTVGGRNMGTLEFRTGATATGTATSKQPGVDRFDLVAIHFTAASTAIAGNSHFVQFASPELRVGGALVGGTMQVDKLGTVALTTDPAHPNQVLDTVTRVATSPISASPFYDDQTGGRLVGNQLTMIDWPGIPNVLKSGMVNNPTVKLRDPATVVIHFDTYLVENNTPVYRIGWTATATFNSSTDSNVYGTARVAIAIDTARTGPVTAVTPEQVAELRSYHFGPDFRRLPPPQYGRGQCW